MNGPAALVCNSFEKVTDPRVDRGNNHDLLEMIFVALTGTICGCNSWVDIERFAKSKTKWFAKHIKLKHGVPSHDTFGRVFSRLDTGEFLTAMHAWIDLFAESLNGKGVAIDGKVLRGSFDRASGQSALHTITAFATETRLVLRQMSVGEQSNEIPTVPELLELLDLAGAVVTLDAMHCQRETAKHIRNAEADYVLTVKGNQGKLAERIAELFLEFGEQQYHVEGLRRYTTTEKSHGRHERREYYTIAAPNEPLFNQWEGLKSIGMVFRRRDCDEEGETTYFISSLPPRVKKISEYIRNHWKIENSQHHTLDVTFTEDKSRIRKGTSPEISAGFRRMALNILQQDTTLNEPIRGKRLRAGWDDAVLDAIYAGIYYT